MFVRRAKKKLNCCERVIAYVGAVKVDSDVSNWKDMCLVLASLCFVSITLPISCEKSLQMQIDCVWTLTTCKLLAQIV